MDEVTAKRLGVIEDGKVNASGLPSAVFELVEAMLDSTEVYDFEIGFIRRDE